MILHLLCPLGVAFHRHLPHQVYTDALVHVLLCTVEITDSLSLASLLL